MQSFEIEQKYVVVDRERLVARLNAVGATFVCEKENRDTYYNHPCRDFAQTGEALRVRREGDVPLVTYKGTKRPGAVKARAELEWRLDPGDVDGRSMEGLLMHLSFRKVATVVKHRQTYQYGSQADSLTITIDEVESLGVDGRAGLFAEIECVLPEESPTQESVEAARCRISALAQQLGLTQPEPRSYLRMQLERG